MVYTLSGHTSFVYSLSVLPSGDVVSGGEDRSVRVWRGESFRSMPQDHQSTYLSEDGELSQTIVHPAISVWAVSSTPNGDIVSGCSDGIVRVFSESEDRWASAEDLKIYQDQVASQALPSQQVGDVKKADLPGPEALAEPGGPSLFANEHLAETNNLLQAKKLVMSKWCEMEMSSKHTKYVTRSHDFYTQAHYRTI